MNAQTKIWLLSILNAENGDIEKAARWMARNFRSIGGVGFFRNQLQQAAS